MWVGLAAWRLGDYAAARREGETSLTLKRRLGLDAEVSRSFNALGLLAWNEGRHREALADFDSAIAAARRRDLNRRLRAAFLAGAEEHSLQSRGRGLTEEELERMLRRYPGNPGERLGLVE